MGVIGGVERIDAGWKVGERERKSEVEKGRGRVKT